MIHLFRLPRFNWMGGLGLFFLVFAPGAFAQIPDWQIEAKEIFKELNRSNNSGLSGEFERRIESASRRFLGRPYDSSGPLGEGPEARFDTDPLVRFDVFDCTTYVETVLALARSKNLEQFELTLNSIRYTDSRVQYEYRNHFVEIDWNPNNQKMGVVRDVTQELAPPDGLRSIRRKVSKREWYANKKISDLRVFGLNETEQSERLQEWQKLGELFSDVEMSMWIVPGDSILGIQPLLADRVSNIGILNIVRNVGGVEMVTHQALLFRDRKQLWQVRHASSKFKKVVQQSLREFVEGQKQSKGYLGINVLRALP